MNGVFLSVSLYVSASCSLPVLRAFFSALVYCAEIERVLRLVVFPVVTGICEAWHFASGVGNFEFVFWDPCNIGLGADMTTLLSRVFHANL